MVGFVNGYGVLFRNAPWECHMIALVQKLVTGSWTWSGLLSATPADTALTDEHMIGAYRADYSRLTPEQIAAEDEELIELYANSRPVSR
jgi:hypothetical protein